jgi:hypothetical protein
LLACASTALVDVVKALLGQGFDINFVNEKVRFDQNEREGENECECECGVRENSVMSSES